jgi:hypothetical protein
MKLICANNKRNKARNQHEPVERRSSGEVAMVSLIFRDAIDYATVRI